MAGEDIHHVSGAVPGREEPSEVLLLGASIDGIGLDIDVEASKSVPWEVWGCAAPSLFLSEAFNAQPAALRVDDEMRLAAPVDVLGDVPF